MNASTHIDRVLDQLIDDLPGTTRPELAALLAVASERRPVSLIALQKLLAMPPPEIERFLALEASFRGDNGPMIELIPYRGETCVRLTQFACNIVNRAWVATAQRDLSS